MHGQLPLQHVDGLEECPVILGLHSLHGLVSRRGDRGSGDVFEQWRQFSGDGSRREQHFDERMMERVTAENGQK